jgi:hypothetical protein
MDENKSISTEGALEIAVAAMERQVKRLFILCIIMFVALVGSNLAWLVYENQYEDVSTVVTQETSSEGGGDAIINGDNAGAVYNGESKANSNDKNEAKEE